MESELQEFDEKCSRQFDKEGHALGITPLPPILAAWRKRWVKAIAKEKKKIKC